MIQLCELCDEVFNSSCSVNQETFGVVDFACNFTTTADDSDASPGPPYVLLSASSNLSGALMGQAVSRKKPVVFEPLRLSAIGG